MQPIARQSLLAGILFVLLAAPAPAAVLVNSVNALVDAVNATAHGGDKTILIADGTYNLAGAYLRIAASGVTVRSASGQRTRVVLDGGYDTTEIFQIVASNVTISDMTLKRAANHPIHVMGGTSANTTGTVLTNLHIIDPGQQAIKVNAAGGRTADHGQLSRSLVELTSSGRAMVLTINGSCYTGGFDAHAATGWVLRDNTIRGFWCAESLAEHGIHLWSGSTGTLVERNLILDCDRGIGFGLGTSPHHGGIIRNNFIAQVQDHGQSDVGIGLESADGAWVYNNTIFLGHAYPNAIEYRFAASTNLIIRNNLTNRSITSRDGGSASLASNLTTAQHSWFVDPASGDLHLRSSLLGVINAGVAVSGLVDDFDRQARPHDGGYDIGADEYQAGGATSGRAMPWLFLLLDE